MTCTYCGKRLSQPSVKDRNNDYHLNCYMDKDGSKIVTKSMLDIIMCKEFMAEICDNIQDKTASTQESRRRFEAIKVKY